MKKMTMLLIGGIGCCMVTDAVAMLAARNTKLMSKIRCVSYRDSISTIQNGNNLLIGLHQDRMKKQLLKRSEILNYGLGLDLTDQFHFDKELDEFAGSLGYCELEIHKNCQKIVALEKENERLEKEYKNWERT